ncbi:Arabinose 5-phosphate isomerase KdsD [Marinibacterium anthonyi]|nr:Arabinose 5-phosphate isomerase KdsD [Marinibacterium anthonyi]
MHATPAIDALLRHPPFDMLPQELGPDLDARILRATLAAGELLFEKGQPLAGVYVIETGATQSEGADGTVVSRRGPGDMLGQKGTLSDGRARVTTRAAEDTTVFIIPPETFRNLVRHHPTFGAWFERGTVTEGGSYATGLTALQVADLMSSTPITCPPDTTVTQAARMMRDMSINSVLVTDGADLTGIVTSRDLTGKVLAEGLSGDIPVTRIMTANPVTIPPTALGLDALVTLADHGISHLPVAENGAIIGMIGKTDLFRHQAATASHMISEIVEAMDAADMARVVARTPELLGQLVSAGVTPQAICRRISDVTDAVTRRLLILAEQKLGPPPVPYLWAACGSQGRREQTGVSDQDNCLILDDAATPDHDAWFADLARFVSDGLAICGYIYCPGDMMATNPRWRQPRRVWRDYFRGWIATPDPEAQMLASVMFDLRPIGGERALFDNLQKETLAAARANSIFVAHMVSNSLKHTPPISLFRGFALIRSGEHKNQVDLKHSGVVPVVDLGRVYALKGALEQVNTRDRIVAAGAAGVLSPFGTAELLDAYDLIADTRLRHQAARIRRGEAPDNFMAPGQLSDLERNHLRDAFMVVKTMQSAAGQNTGMLG